MANRRHAGTTSPDSTAPARIESGTVWRDTEGNRIEAHGGGMLFYEGRWYWYGENKTHGPHNKVGVGCYSSADLISWRNEGIVLRAEAMPEVYRDTGVCERPKVIYNLATAAVAMWMRLDARGYTASEAGIAVSHSPVGPFRFVTSMRPIRGMFDPSVSDPCYQAQYGATFRDMNLFVDDDGSGYVLYSSEANATLYINSRNRKDPGAAAFWDPYIMVYPKTYAWPRETVDMPGPGY